MVTFLIITLGFLAYRYDQPMNIEPNPGWETTIASMDARRKHLFIPSGDIQLEGEPLLPA